MEHCPCGNESYQACCEPYITGALPAPTAEALMRSRYSAYVKKAIDYLADTLHPNERSDFDRKAAREWAEHSEWLGLEIVKAKGGAQDSMGEVEFIARYRQDGTEHTHHEVSRFKKVNGSWHYLDGRIIPPPGSVFQNDLCPCGSGNKYKRCCGKKAK